MNFWSGLHQAKSLLSGEAEKTHFEKGPRAGIIFQGA